MLQSGRSGGASTSLTSQESQRLGWRLPRVLTRRLLVLATVVAPLVGFLWLAVLRYTPSDAIFIERVGVSADLSDKGITQERFEQHIQSSLRSLLDKGDEVASVKVMALSALGRSGQDIAHLAGMAARNVAVTAAASDLPWERWAYRLGSLFAFGSRHVYVSISAIETVERDVSVHYTLEVPGKSSWEASAQFPQARILDKSAVTNGPAFKLVEFALPDAAIQTKFDVDNKLCECLTLDALRLLEKKLGSISELTLALLLAQTVARPLLHNHADSVHSDAARAARDRIVVAARMRYPESIFEYFASEVSASQCREIGVRAEKFARSDRRVGDIGEWMPYLTYGCLLYAGSPDEAKAFLSSQTHIDHDDLEVVRFFTSMYEAYRSEGDRSTKFTEVIGSFKGSQNQNLSEWIEILVLTATNGGEVNGEMKGGLSLVRLREMGAGAEARLQNLKECSGRTLACLLELEFGPARLASTAGGVLLAFNDALEEGGRLCIRSYMAKPDADTAQCVALYYLKSGNPISAIEFYENAYKLRNDRSVTDLVPSRYKGGDILNDELRLALAAIYLHQGDRTTALSLVGDSAYADPMWRDKRDSFEAYVHARACNVEALDQAKKNSYLSQTFEFAYLIANARLTLQSGETEKASNLARELILQEQVRDAPFGLFSERRATGFTDIPWYALSEGHMIMGYVHSARGDAAAARHAFHKAFEKSNRTSREAKKMMDAEMSHAPTPVQRPTVCEQPLDK